MRWIASALALLILAARPAHACEDHVFSRTVDGIAADGSFVYTERTFGGRVLESVNVANPNGKRIAWCELGETDAGPADVWQCHGDRRFRATRGVSADRVAKAWTQILGPTTPLVDLDTAPEGVAQAICARVPSVWAGMRIDCAPSNAEPLENASSPLVFLRFRIKPIKFCGSTSTHDEMTWVTKPDLAARLAKRGSIFTSRKQPQLALRALEALVWLTPNDSAAEAALERARAAVQR